MNDDDSLSKFETVKHDFYHNGFHPAGLIFVDTETLIYNPRSPDSFQPKFYLSTSLYEYFSNEKLDKKDEIITGHDLDVYQDVGEVCLYSNKTLGLYSRSLIQAKSPLNPVIGSSVFSFTKFMAYLYPTYHVVFQDYKLDMDDAVVYVRDPNERDMQNAAKRQKAQPNLSAAQIEALEVSVEEVNQIKKQFAKTTRGLYEDDDNLNMAIAIAKVEGLSEIPDTKLESSTGWTKNQALFIEHLAVICMAKNFVNNEQIKEFIKSRLSTFKATVKALEITQDPSQYYMVDAIRFISTNMAFFPKFKQCIYNYTLLNRVKEAHLSLTSTLLDGTQMTVFNFIALFLTESPKSAAHVDPEILQETANWWVAKEQISEKYGGNWGLYKLYEPEGMLTKSSEYAKLSFVSLVSAYASTRSSKIKNIITGIKHNSKLVASLKKKLGDEFISVVKTRKSVELSSELKEYLGLNFQKVNEYLEGKIVGEFDQFDRDYMQAVDDYFVKYPHDREMN